MRSRESLFEFFQLKACEGCSVASLLSLLRILIVEVNITVVGHRAMAAKLRHSTRSVVVRGSTVVWRLLQLCLFGNAHAGLMEGVQAIDVENFLG